MIKNTNIIKKGEIESHLIWFDSLGAKCSSIFVRTPDITMLIDPGAAEMQPGYPLSAKEKECLKLKALEKISEYSTKAEIVFISHYHYDHHTLMSKIPKNLNVFYKDKVIWVKNPNKWINHSQWERARLFLEEIFNELGGKGKLYRKSQKVKVPELEEELPLAAKKDYGNYNRRKKELLEKGKNRVMKIKDLWESNKWLHEFEFANGEIVFADGKEFKIGETRIRFTPPLYHGIEYDRIGWVIGLVIEHNSTKFIYSSDLQGPQIEDYAEWIIKENPDILVLDGFPTYLLGFLVNKINLERAKENIIRIAKEVKSDTIIYDHHLLREPRYKERFKEVYEKVGEKVITAAEYMGKEPLILKVKNKHF